MTEFAVIMLCVALTVTGFGVGAISAIIISRNAYEALLVETRREWFKLGFDAGDGARCYVVARSWAKNHPEYQPKFEADCQPGGRWEKDHRLFGEVETKFGRSVP